MADQLKLNLVHVIVRSCCPTIPMHIKADGPPSPTARVPQGSLRRPSSRVILNDPGQGMSQSHDARHPELLANDLLTRMIVLMKGKELI